MAFKPPTADELAGVQRLKDRIAATSPPVTHKFNDTALLRFYRGRKAVDEDAYTAVMKHVKWRIDNSVDKIANEVYRFQREMDSGKFVVEGYDKTGRPAIFIYAAKINKNDRDLDQMKLLIIYTMEEVIKRTKPDEERMLICFDLTGFRMSCMDYDMVKLLISINEFNYPETLSVAYIINSPFIFYACWAVIKPWLDPVTAAKVTFVNSDKLSEYITFEAPPWVAKLTNCRNSGQNGAPSPNAVGNFSDSGKTSAGTSVGAQTPGERTAEFDALFNQRANPQSPYASMVPSPSSSQKSSGISKRSWW